MLVEILKDTFEPAVDGVRKKTPLIYRKGLVIDLPDDVAKQLIKDDKATETTKEEKPAKKKKEEKDGE